MSRFAILLSGPLVPTAQLKAQLAGARAIAADGGMAHAAPLGLEPELWVGDFDSSPPELLQRYAHVPRQVHPTAKDKTDGELALEAALALGARELWLVGALGGRTDQTLAHLTLALRLAEQGLRVRLSSGTEEAYPLLPGKLRLELAPGRRLSVVGLSDLEGLRLGGVRWPLAGARVELGSSLTLSNETLGPVGLELSKGYGVVFVYLDGVA
ncbi:MULTISPECIES: thiamine diphosphokinase [unclassified Meiothermus]|uniref:thiamine diphosphokinase n=1 Tax=unclassified Meiothermus TaxID=370471 RepID=UPI000D7CDE70|nr:MULTISPECIES: thiamine diphosphokinase [unclassified Meiothermus]PZA08668.1 thiamine diphosphokinase [Meiothermus sp. Pnk-1]RYM40713.1 thiamine diphosphokinase [Meiothermus sp. PNK-Is4]